MTTLDNRFYEALKNNNLSAIKQFMEGLDDIESYINTASPELMNRTPITYALELGYSEVFSYFLKNHHSKLTPESLAATTQQGEFQGANAAWFLCAAIVGRQLLRDFPELRAKLLPESLAAQVQQGVHQGKNAALFLCSTPDGQQLLQDFPELHAKLTSESLAASVRQGVHQGKNAIWFLCGSLHGQQLLRDFPELRAKLTPENLEATAQQGEEQGKNGVWLLSTEYNSLLLRAHPELIQLFSKQSINQITVNNESALACLKKGRVDLYPALLLGGFFQAAEVAQHWNDIKIPYPTRTLFNDYQTMLNALNELDCTHLNKVLEKDKRLLTVRFNAGNTLMHELVLQLNRTTPWTVLALLEHHSTLFSLLSPQFNEDNDNGIKPYELANPEFSGKIKPPISLIQHRLETFLFNSDTMPLLHDFLTGHYALESAFFTAFDRPEYTMHGDHQIVQVNSLKLLQETLAERLNVTFSLFSLLDEIEQSLVVRLNEFTAKIETARILNEGCRLKLLLSKSQINHLQQLLLNFVAFNESIFMDNRLTPNMMHKTDSITSASTYPDQVITNSELKDEHRTKKRQREEQSFDSFADVAKRTKICLSKEEKTTTCCRFFRTGNMEQNEATKSPSVNHGQ